MYKVSFNHKDQGFFYSLKISVDEYFASRHKPMTGDWRLYLKTLIVFPLVILLYVTLLLGHQLVAIDLTLTLLFVACLVFIAFNIMHDACHGCYSASSRINNLMGLTMNALGGNAFLWKITHNVIHHTYTNIDGVDHDIANWPLLRQCATQKRKSFHRYQHLYMFLLYAFHTMAWMLIFDFLKYFSRRIATTPIKVISPGQHLMFWLGKLFYVSIYIALPIYFRGWPAWLAGFLIVHFTMGLVVTIVFQLAHLVENVSFDWASDEPRKIESAWAIHEIQTTSDFATENSIVSWFLGGLNFQVEHHLFPHVSHVHYPALNRIVRAACAKHHLPYHSFPTLKDALASHVGLMRTLGREVRSTVNSGSTLHSK